MKNITEFICESTQYNNLEDACKKLGKGHEGILHKALNLFNKKYMDFIENQNHLSVKINIKYAGNGRITIIDKNDGNKYIYDTYKEDFLNK